MVVYQNISISTFALHLLLSAFIVAVRTANVVRAGEQDEDKQSQTTCFKVTLQVKTEHSRESGLNAVQSSAS